VILDDFTVSCPDAPKDKRDLARLGQPDHVHRRRGADIRLDPKFVQPRENPPERTGGLCLRATSSSSYIFFAFFFFLPFVVAFAIAALGPVAAIGAVASDPDFATAPPLVPLAPPVCAMAPAADNASAMAATGMISTRIIILPFK
jgi:hypothetical protein